MNWITENPTKSVLIFLLLAVLVWYFFINKKFKVFSKGGITPSKPVGLPYTQCKGKHSDGTILCRTCWESGHWYIPDDCTGWSA